MDAPSLSARRAWIEILPSKQCAEIAKVALRKESVDRNLVATPAVLVTTGSLSARRAWIEIGVMTFGPGEVFVALRKESVDRNPYIPLAKVRHCEVALRKESVDRNVKWQQGEVSYGKVALRKESVDRNAHSRRCRMWAFRRSPQGERG